MVSQVLGDSQRQLTLSLDARLSEVYRTARDCIAACVYRRGLVRGAGQLDMAPGNLSVALSDDPTRKFGVDEAERYTQVTGDKTWIYYLIAKYLGDEQGAARDHALSEVQQMLAALPDKLAAAGLTVVKKGR